MLDDLYIKVSDAYTKAWEENPKSMETIICELSLEKIADAMSD